MSEELHLNEPVSRVRKNSRNPCRMDGDYKREKDTLVPSTNRNRNPRLRTPVTLLLLYTGDGDVSDTLDGSLRMGLHTLDTPGK